MTARHAGHVLWAGVHLKTQAPQKRWLQASTCGATTKPRQIPQ